MPVAEQFDVRRVIAEVAQKQGVLLEEGDPLFVALEAHAVVLQEVAARLLSEIEEASKHLKTAVPGQVDAAMKASLETAAKAAGNDRAINEHLGDAYWQIGRLLDARYAWGVASQTAEGDAAIRLAGKVDTGLPRR